MLPLKKFHGEFRDLIPAGYTFQKLYARNYRCYWKETKHCDHIWIWQHHGGYVELNDLHQYSGLVIDKIISDPDGWTNSSPIEYWKGFWALDMENNVIVPYVPVEHDFVARMVRKLVPDIETPEGKLAYDAHAERWRRVAFEDETIDELKRMADRGWLKVENNVATC